MPFQSKAVIEYWRGCLIDGDRPSITSTLLKHSVEVSESILTCEKLDNDTVESILGNWRLGRKKGASVPESIPLIICPFLGKLQADHGAKSKEHPKVIVPLLIGASLETMSGTLHPEPTKQPWIPREFLEPCPDAPVILGKMKSIDDFLTENDWDEHCVSWEAACRYALELFEHVIGQSPDSLEIEGYSVANTARILIPASLSGPGKHLERLLNHILNQDSDHAIPLLSEYASLQPNSGRPILDSEREMETQLNHVAQMGSDYALADDQRKALLHFLATEDRQILAINGPPGTGKTTLLQNVVATLWTNAALEPNDPDPPVIVATSTNNQAITNIIESFSGSIEESDFFDQHWLPEIESFGLYCASRSKTDSNPHGKYQYANSSFTDLLESTSYLDGAETFFMNQFQFWGDPVLETVESAKHYLQSKLIDCVEKIRRGIKYQASWLMWKSFVEQNYPSPNGDFSSALNEISDSSQRLKSEEQKWLNHQKEAELYYSQTPFWMQLLGWFPPVKSKLEARMRFFVLDRQIPFDEPLSNLAGLRAFMRSKLASLESEQNNIALKREEICNHKDSYEQACRNWEDWCDLNDIDPGTAQLQEELDVGLRSEAFRLAQHYWEARWLQERKEEVETNYKEKQSVEKQEKKWRRNAKLMPCTISTCYMLPNFFHAYPGKYAPLYNFIDLLIVDEAGQVTPEIGAPVFALAKKALVVGDILQIEPVAKISHGADLGNVRKFLDNEIADNTDWFINESGMSTSKGCLMRIAQNTSAFSQNSGSGGMFLKKHYRCYDELIAYCNELAYNGQLEPCRGKAQPETLPTWGYAHIPGTSQQVGKSRRNKMEAKAIVTWIETNAVSLKEQYPDLELEEIIGIVTPFGTQAEWIEATLDEIGLSEITVGTVHRLQGAQRPVIIFSPVYDTSFKGTYFFDKGANMLNVAVSRAKDHFLVFGNMSFFNSSFSDRPSGLLARYLFASESNELKGFDFPVREELETITRIRHLRSLQEHQSIFTECLEKAKFRSVISSPYLSHHALETDNIPALLQRHADRIEILIFCDQGFNQNGGSLNETAQKALELLEGSGVSVIFANGIHNKTLCMDESLLVEGSFNWLSAVRVEGHRWQRLESSICYEGSEVGKNIKDILDEMYKRRISE